jgi:hypothetical protein
MEEELTNPEPLQDGHVSGLVPGGTPAPPEKEAIIRRKKIRSPKYLKKMELCDKNCIYIPQVSHVTDVWKLIVLLHP